MSNTTNFIRVRVIEGRQSGGRFAMGTGRGMSRNYAAALAQAERECRARLAADAGCAAVAGVVPVAGDLVTRQVIVTRNGAEVRQW